MVDYGPIIIFAFVLVGVSQLVIHYTHFLLQRKSSCSNATGCFQNHRTYLLIKVMNGMDI